MKTILAMCGDGDGKVRSARYEAANFDFNDHDLTHHAADRGVCFGNDIDVAPTAHYSWLWDRALGETQTV